MTSVSLSRRFALLALLASSLWLAGCGGKGGGGNGTTNIRAINLTSDLASADLYANDGKQFGALTPDTLAPGVSLESNTYTLTVKPAGDSTVLFTGSYSLSKDQSYAAVVWGRQSALRVSTLGESEDPANVADTDSRIRILNATLDSGTFDIYVTAPDVNPADVPPVQSALTGGSLSGFRTLPATSYRIRVTGAGNPDDVRLDMPTVALAAKSFNTLVITPAGTGGVLLNGTVIQQGSVTPVSVKNTQARVRVAASVIGGGVVAAKVGTLSLLNATTSPRIGLTAGSYKQVTAGSVPLTVQVNGTILPSAGNSTLTAGADYTLLVYGPAASPSVQLIPDDNRLPNVSTRAKIRLVNGLSGTALLSAVISGSTNSNTTDVASASASPYINVAAVGSTRLDVFSSETFTPLFTQQVTTSGQNLLSASGVYTVFMLDGASAPAGFWVTDR